MLVPRDRRGGSFFPADGLRNFDLDRSAKRVNVAQGPARWGPERGGLVAWGKWTKGSKIFPLLFEGQGLRGMGRDRATKLTFIFQASG